MEKKPKIDGAEDSMPAAASHPLRKFMAPGIALLAAFAIIVGVTTLKNNDQISGQGAGASCHGPNCQAKVQIGARVATTGYGSPVSYNNLKIKRGQQVALMWAAQNADYCRAAEGWTDYIGSYYEPTVYNQVLTNNQKFSVECFARNKNGVDRMVAKSSINIIVQ